MGTLRHSIKKKSPDQGTKTAFSKNANFSAVFLIKKKSPDQGTKTYFSFHSSNLSDNY